MKTQKIIPVIVFMLILPYTSSGTVSISKDIDEHVDGYFIYNLTKSLSNIIFNAYKPGEIAKGRAFGTKGEYKAASILSENMSKICLLYTSPSPRD